MKQIQIVPASKKEEMRLMLYKYLTELSEFDPDIKFDENGTPIYKWFDCYWEDKDRFPIYLIIDGQVAGLALIREMDNMEYDYAEFYVEPQFRGNGNSMWFATEVEKLFDGKFTFSTRHTNPRAIKFWGKFASHYKHDVSDDEIWRNWVIYK